MQFANDNTMTGDDNIGLRDWQQTFGDDDVLLNTSCPFEDSYRDISEDSGTWYERRFVYYRRRR